MSNHDKDYFIEELVFCIKQSDIIKAKAVLQFFPETSIKNKDRALYEISKASYKIAWPMLNFLVKQAFADSLIINKIYAIMVDKAHDSPEFVIRYLDQNIGKDKIIYLKVIKKIKLKESISLLKEILVKEKDPDLLNETLLTIGVIGDQECIDSITSYLFIENIKLKRAAITALSQIGATTITDKLVKAICGDETTDNMIIDAIAAINDDSATAKLCDMLASQSINIKTKAAYYLTKKGTSATPFLIKNLRSQHIDIIIYTLNILSHTADPYALPSIQEILYNEHKNPNVRFATYQALGAIPPKKFVITLIRGLEDNVEHVRIAAAKAINDNISSVLIMGLKNLIEANNNRSYKVVAAIVDAQADKIFKYLININQFKDIALDYLTHKAHPLVKQYFIEILMNINRKLANTIKDIVPNSEQNKKIIIYVIDSSEIMLKLYMKKLYDLGYNPTVLQPLQAVDMIRKSKPHLVITDSDMFELNGIKLSQKIRKLFTPEQLPIILTTINSNINKQLIYETGINQILNKPFNDNELDQSIKKLINF